jgi:DNA-binding MarR family transcriptional regulator
MKLEEAIQSTRFRSEFHKATLNILYSAWWLKTLLSQELKSSGITHEQYNVLRILKGKHPEQMCVRDITSRMIEKNSNVPRIIDRLLKKKLVKRNVSEADRRETVISLTPAGTLLLEQSADQIQSLMDKKLNLTIQESKVLNNLLEKMREAE